jgi:hypothetical protein
MARLWSLWSTWRKAIDIQIMFLGRGVPLRLPRWGRCKTYLYQIQNVFLKGYRNRRDDVQTGASITATNGLSVDGTKTRQIGSTEVMSPNTSGDIAPVKMKKKKKKSTSSKKKSKAPKK